MSGYQRPRYGVGRGVLSLPRIAPGPSAQVAAQANAAFAQIEMADAQNLKTGQEAQVPAVLLTDTNNVTWRVTINTDGTINTAKVPVR
jgi:hypothetical protein